MKLRGQRIELGEIEHALRALPGVDEAVVLVHADALVAYVSPAALVQADGSGHAQAAAGTDAEAVTVEDAACAAGERGLGAAVPFGRVAALAGAATALPAYMVPSIVVGVREWPRTSSAKIDRNRLPPPEEGGGAAAEVKAAHSPAERAARDAIAAVLGLTAEAVSVDANFFELGANSLKVVQLRNQLQHLLGERAPAIPVALAYEHPTARQMAAFLEAQMGLPAREAQAVATADSVRHLSQERTALTERHESLGDCLIRCKVGDPSKPVMFGITGIEGTATMFANLPTEGDLYALEHEHFATGLAKHLREATMAELAAKYAARIIKELARRERAPTKGTIAPDAPIHRATPYILIGASFGAVLAHHMAVVMHERGRPAAGLVLIDPESDYGYEVRDVDPYSISGLRTLRQRRKRHNCIIAAGPNRRTVCIQLSTPRSFRPLTHFIFPRYISILFAPVHLCTGGGLLRANDLHDAVSSN